MTMHIPKWVLAAFVGAAPMLGLVFFILFSCTLLGLVQRCKISLSKAQAKRRRCISHDQSSIINENFNSGTSFQHASSVIIVSPFDDIPMKDIDADSTSKGYSETKDDVSTSSQFRRNRSIDTSQASSEYDNGSSSIFDDNDYEQDRISLIETASQRRLAMKQQTAPETIINV